MRTSLLLLLSGPSSVVSSEDRHIHDISIRSAFYLLLYIVYIDMTSCMLPGPTVSTVCLKLNSSTAAPHMMGSDGF